MNSEVLHSSPEIKPINLDFLRSVKDQNFIYDQSPFWWKIDYSHDPREYISYEKFQSQLVEIKTNDNESFFLYPNPKVPITTIELDVFDQKLNFMVTARPFHPKERNSQPSDYFLNTFKTPNKLKEAFLKDDESTRPYLRKVPHEHFFPHIRGLITSKRENTFFWYSIHNDTLFKKAIEESLEKKNMSYLGIFDEGYGGSTRNYPLVEEEINEHPDLFNTKKFLSLSNSFFIQKKVSAEEFVEYHQNQKNLSLIYPVKIPEISLDLPLYIANHSIDSDEITKPLVYGIYLPGIMTVKDERIAKSISQSISKDLGLQVDIFLSIPKKGRPEQKRISLDEL